MENKENLSGRENISVQTRPLIQLLFTMVILFFFFNFFTISCDDGQEVGSVRGIELVTGSQTETSTIFLESKNERIPSSIWAIIAFGSAVIGLGIFLIKGKNEAMIGSVAGLVGFVSLIILQIVVMGEVKSKANGYSVEANFQFAYWGALTGMGIASLLSYLRTKNSP